MLKLNPLSHMAILKAIKGELPYNSYHKFSSLCGDQPTLICPWLCQFGHLKAHNWGNPSVPDKPGRLTSPTCISVYTPGLAAVFMDEQCHNPI